MNTQKGSAHVIIIIGLTMLLIGSLGFIFWQNFVQEKPVGIDSNTSRTKESKSETVDNTLESPYTLWGAIDDISKVMASEGCGGYGAKSTLDFEQVPNHGLFKYVGGMSFINEGLTHAYVQYGCGSQGSVALLRNVDKKWKIVSEDARIYPMCTKVRGEEFPTTVVDKCYASDEATDPEAI